MAAAVVAAMVGAMMMVAVASEARESVGRGPFILEPTSVSFGDGRRLGVMG
jgi:hypothetical protein